MNAERCALGLALVLALSLWPATATAQSLDDQADEALAKGQRVAGDARDDPRGAVSNASNPSWQAEQANWTEAWTCASAYAVDEEAGEAADSALDCPAPRSERAGEEQQAEEEANESTARAEEAEADAEQAARDQAAATEAFAEDVAEEPSQSPSHLDTFLQRTFAVLNRTVAIAEKVASLPVDGALAVGQGLSAGVQTAGEGLASLGHATMQASHAAAGGAQDGVEAGVEGALGLAREARSALASAASSTGEGLRSGVDELRSGWRTLAEAVGLSEAPTTSGEAREAEPTDLGDEVGPVQDLDVPVPRDPP